MNSVVNFCGYEFDPAPDEWDRLYGVDFYLKINRYHIGIQVKPQTFNQPFSGRYKGAVRNQHRKFKNKYGGHVFVVYKDEKGNIINHEICKEIKAEIERLKKMQS